MKTRSDGLANPVEMHEPTRFERLILNPATPVVVVPLGILSSVFLDMGMDGLLFHASPLHSLDAPLSEWVMRATFAVVMLAGGIVWSRAIRNYHRQTDALTAAHERMRALNARLARGEAIERGDVAFRLQENVAQTLSAAGMFLSTIDDRHLSVTEAEAMRASGRALARAMSEVRDLAQELQPTPLTDFGLECAIDSLAKRVMRSSGVSIEVSRCDSPKPVRQETAMAAYQVVAEVFESATQDPRTSSITVDSECGGTHLLITVKWNGSHDADMLSSDEWLRSMGGEVTPRPGSLGSSVLVRVPSEAA